MRDDTHELTRLLRRVVDLQKFQRGAAARQRSTATAEPPARTWRHAMCLAISTADKLARFYCGTKVWSPPAAL